jgi:type IV secretion system protein VirB10
MIDDSEERIDSASPTKVDPESLVLRARPSRVVRFRRGAIVAIAALGSTAIIGVTWVALKPAAMRIVSSDSSGEVQNSAPPEALAAAPRSYGDVPKLGPPLPGDLGRPILQHQRTLETTEPTSGVDQAAQAAETERQRIAAEQRAARESGVMLQLAGAARPATVTPATGVVERDASASIAKPQLALDPVRDPGNQQRKSDFVASTDRTGDSNPHAMTSQRSPYTLTAGTIIAASLITGLNSDLPGLVTAQVTENAYDSVTGQTLLLPQGSRLIGSYDSVVAFGQQRALVVWQRILFPDGSSIRIDNMPASDTAGFAGLADKVDRHTWQILKGVALSTLLGVGSELSFGSSESDLVRAIRESAQQSGARAGDQLVARNLAIQPTITIRPGSPLRIVVSKDLILRPWPNAEH